MSRDEWSPNTKCLQNPAYKSSAPIKNKNSIDFHKIPWYPIMWQTRYKIMRKISKENKQVYTGIASAPNQQQLDEKNIKTDLDNTSGEIFVDKTI